MKRLEYIWLDGNETPQLRSKTRFAPSIEQWNFDGGSTNQGDLKDSDRMLNPVQSYKDPFVDGITFLFLGSISNAALKDLANPLKHDSIIW